MCRAVFLHLERDVVRAWFFSMARHSKRQIIAVLLNLSPRRSDCVSQRPFLFSSSLVYEAYARLNLLFFTTIFFLILGQVR